MPTVRLIYASTARDPQSYTDLTDILRAASPRNRDRSISGLLVLAGEHFLQVLEGERASINRLYARIAVDSRHFDPIIVEYTSIRKRDFADWGMKLIRVDDSLTAVRLAVAMKHLGGTTIEPATLRASTARGLLLELATLERTTPKAA
jgi:Sensors of blue-light using FAD